MPFRKLEAPEALDDLGWRQQAGSGRFVGHPEAMAALPRNNPPYLLF